MKTHQYVRCGKHRAIVSTHAEMQPPYHHFVRLDYPIVVGPEHMAVGYFTLAKRSTRTGATMSNEIHFLRIAKMKKDGSPSKVEAWVEYNHSDNRLDAKGLRNFDELHRLSPQYKAFEDMQVELGTWLYHEYHNNLPDRHFNETAMLTYLALKRHGQLRREEALQEAHCKVLEARTKFLGNDPIIGLPSLAPKPEDVDLQEIWSQRRKVNNLQKNILTSPRLAIDFTDHLELRDERAKLDRMERAAEAKTPDLERQLRKLTDFGA